MGSNLGDRQQHLLFARDRLASLLTSLRVSEVMETAPVDVVGAQSPFLNAAAVGGTTLSPHQLLASLLAIERAAGRERPYPGAARTLDLDLILYGSAVIDAPDLSLPHPRFRERRFVLEPLAAIAPEMRDPVTSLTMADLLARLPPER